MKPIYAPKIVHSRLGGRFANLLYSLCAPPPPPKKKKKKKKKKKEEEEEGNPKK